MGVRVPPFAPILELFDFAAVRKTPLGMLLALSSRRKSPQLMKIVRGRGSGAYGEPLDAARLEVHDVVLILNHARD